jgi:class 3 adenylate cyclase
MYDQRMAFTSRTFAGLACFSIVFLVGFAAVAKSTRKPARFNDVLGEEPWEELVARVGRALAWIATTQEALLRIVREEPRPVQMRRLTR